MPTFLTPPSTPRGARGPGKSLTGLLLIALVGLIGVWALREHGSLVLHSSVSVAGGLRTVTGVCTCMVPDTKCSSTPSTANTDDSYPEQLALASATAAADSAVDAAAQPVGSAKPGVQQTFAKVYNDGAWGGLGNGSGLGSGEPAHAW